MLTRSALVLGGAASGKSAWAEEVLKNVGQPMVYVATGRIFDDEVAQKVAVHKKRRDARWRTIEAPLDVGPALESVAADDSVLIDCATMWLTNHMMDGNDLTAAQDALLAALRACPARWIIVSNEVGQGIVPNNALSRRFREAQGRLNIVLAREAETVVQVTAGLPLALKGQLP